MPRISEEVDHVLVTREIGAHRPRTELVTVARDQHGKADLLHQVPGAILIAHVVVAHGPLPGMSGAITPRRAAMFRPPQRNRCGEFSRAAAACCCVSARSRDSP